MKLLAVSAALVGGMGLLAVEGSRSATIYYQTVPEFLAASAPSTKAVRVTGHVTSGTIVREAGKPLRFELQDPAGAQRVVVTYSGLVPDTFKDGAEVVVEGRRTPTGTFEASTLLAKCPSKYEADEKAKAASR